ncbi:type II toxin-antitoxin system RelE/ParE family toxin [Caminibacter pacificus]|jgi:phage-related protein
MKWQILFFNEKVEEDTLSFPPKILAKLLHIFELIEELGPKIGEPYIKYLDNGLLEIRAKGQEGIGRSIFCYQKENNIVILHSFIKKSQKTPKKELRIALQRKKELENGNL